MTPKFYSNFCGNFCNEKYSSCIEKIPETSIECLDTVMSKMHLQSLACLIFGHKLQALQMALSNHPLYFFHALLRLHSSFFSQQLFRYTRFRESQMWVIKMLLKEAATATPEARSTGGETKMAWWWWILTTGSICCFAPHHTVIRVVY